MGFGVLKDAALISSSVQELYNVLAFADDRGLKSSVEIEIVKSKAIMMSDDVAMEKRKDEASVRSGNQR